VEENTECSNCGASINLEPRKYRSRNRAFDDECFGDRGKSGFPLIFGAFLVLIGLSSLLKDLVPWFNLDVLWPLFLVGIGLLIVTKGMNKGR
jgi:hypothetical protein